MTPTSRQIGIGRPSFLSEHQKRDIYDAALHVLGEIGMTLHHDEAQALMLAAGCTRDDEDRVHVAAGLVTQARASAPASFMVYDRGGEPAMKQSRRPQPQRGPV
jgi:trimethylamine:corrinoid methyltransferase-like protein